MCVFETQAATGSELFVWQDSGVSQIFRLIILSNYNFQLYLAMKMWLCEDKLKGETAHFRLPCESQTRACLSSLLLKMSQDLGLQCYLLSLKSFFKSLFVYCLLKSLLLDFVSF